MANIDNREQFWQSLTILTTVDKVWSNTLKPFLNDHFVVL